MLFAAVGVPLSSSPLCCLRQTANYIFAILKNYFITKEHFIQNFQTLVIKLYSLTSEHCYNHLPVEYKFIIAPSEYITSSHLTEEENSCIPTWIKQKNKLLSFDEVTELLYKNGKATLWADCNIYYVTEKYTVIKILFSRRFRDETELYYLDLGTGPFKPTVAITPPPAAKMNAGKFDVNWKKKIDERKNINLLQKINNWLFG